MTVNQNELLILVDSYPGASEKSKASIKAQRVFNTISQIQKICNQILETDKTDGIKYNQVNLNEKLKELSSIFHESTPTEQKRFIELLMERDKEMWSKWISDGFDDFGREVIVIIDTWDKFNKLPKSTPEIKDRDWQVKSHQVITRERILLAIYWLSMIDIMRAFRRS